MYLLIGALGYISLIAGLIAVTHGAAAATARALGVVPFRWFDSKPSSGASWRHAIVRVTSSLAPLLATLVLLFFGILARGESVPTTVVKVGAGPAESAGIRTGDRILSVDSVPITSFDALRSELKRRAGERQIELEREGRKWTLAVTPRDSRIGVTPVYDQRAVGVGEAVASTLETQGTALKGVFERAFGEQENRVTLMGPVGIVREVNEQQGSSSFLMFLGLIGCFTWPLAAGVHAFDALTFRLFRMTHPWAFSGADEWSAAPLARVQQALLISLLAFVPLALLRVIQETAAGDRALLGILPLLPVAFSSAVLVFIAGSLRWGKSRALLALGCSLAIPCAVVGIAAWLLRWLRSELTQRGFRVTGLATASH